VRWSRAGMGKRGGARVVYTKARFDNLPTAFLLQLKVVFEDGQS
jgi:hypothetical protein